MSSSVGVIHIIGNLGRNPELRYTPQGKAVCDYSVAVNVRARGKDGEWYDKVLWYKVTSWDKQAENDSKYLNKGKTVSVIGRLDVEDWVDKNHANRYTLTVQPMQITYLGGKPEGGQENEMQEFSGTPVDPADVNDGGEGW